MSDKDVKVSVIIPVYNTEMYLNECIQSVVNQSYRNLEIILVDDGSADSSSEICDSWMNKDKRISVIHKKNEGLSKARNTGLDIAKGEYILFVDSDDIISLFLIEALVSHITDKKRMIVCDKTRFINEVPAEKKREYSSYNCGKDLLSRRGGMYCWGVLFSKELIDEIDLRFDGALGNLEDVVWNGIYCRYISEIVFVDVLYYYRMNPNSVTSKCSDHRWQIASWLTARKSLMDWFTDKELTTVQKKEVKAVFRHCQNNIYAECLAGKVSSRELRKMEKSVDLDGVKAHVLIPERILMSYFPRIYYYLYTWLITIISRNPN